MESWHILIAVAVAAIIGYFMYQKFNSPVAGTEGMMSCGIEGCNMAESCTSPDCVDGGFSE